jgi:hypothetical protein
MVSLGVLAESTTASSEAGGREVAARDKIGSLTRDKSRSRGFTDPAARLIVGTGPSFPWVFRWREPAFTAGSPRGNISEVTSGTSGEGLAARSGFGDAMWYTDQAFLVQGCIFMTEVDTADVRRHHIGPEVSRHERLKAHDPCTPARGV